MTTSNPPEHESFLDPIPMTIVEPSTGETVDLSGLRPAERLMCLINALVDPETYDGMDYKSCLIGQAATGYVNQHPEVFPNLLSIRNETEVIARVTGLPWHIVHDIYLDAGDVYPASDLETAKQVAREVLETYEEDERDGYDTC